jgi:hypothetical protein
MGRSGKAVKLPALKMQALENTRKNERARENPAPLILSKAVLAG